MDSLSTTIMQVNPEYGSFMETVVFGIKVSEYGLAFLCVLGGFVLRFLVMGFTKHLIHLSKKTDNQYDDILIEAFKRPVGWVCLLLGIWGALYLLPLPTEPIDIDKFVREFMKAAGVAMMVWLAMRLVRGFGLYYEGRAVAEKTPMAGFIPVGRKSINVFIVIIGGLLIIQNLGYSIASLLAGLGIGGAAIALASRDTIANLFGSFVVFVDRPFHVGDWVEIEGVEGTVEELGLRVTRIRTFSNSQITFPNSKFTTTAIQNWSRMQKRRIKMTIRVAYDTPADKLRAAIAGIREIILSDDLFHHDFFVVNFTEFSAYSLDIYVNCFTLTTVWAEYLQTREDFLLKIKTEFEKLGINFALPTQLLQVDESYLPNRPN
jgi:MscS family membrane protein